MRDNRLTPIRPRIRELQREIDDLEWMGLAPEKLSDKLNEPLFSFLSQWPVPLLWVVRRR